MVHRQIQLLCTANDQFWCYLLSKVMFCHCRLFSMRFGFLHTWSDSIFPRQQATNSAMTVSEDEKWARCVPELFRYFFRKIFVKSLVLCFRSPYKGTDIVLNSVTSVFLQKIPILSGKKDDLGRPYWKICKIFEVDFCFTFFQKLLLISQWKLCFSFKSTFFFSLRP